MSQLYGTSSSSALLRDTLKLTPTSSYPISLSHFNIILPVLSVQRSFFMSTAAGSMCSQLDEAARHRKWRYLQTDRWRRLIMDHLYFGSSDGLTSQTDATRVDYRFMLMFLLSKCSITRNKGSHLSATMNSWHHLSILPWHFNPTMPYITLTFWKRWHFGSQWLTHKSNSDGRADTFS